MHRVTFVEAWQQSEGKADVDEGKSRRESKVMGPTWLKPLLETSFFASCRIHGLVSHKSECNLFCLQCMGEGICVSCLPDHKDHHVVQIRRSSYHDVIRVSEIQRVLDITSVQTYIINGARVVFLNERPQPKPAKGVLNICEGCERSLLDTYRFCSLGCKLGDVDKQYELTSLTSMPSEGSSPHTKAHRSKKPSQSSKCKGEIRQDEVHSEQHHVVDINIRPFKRRKSIPQRAPLGNTCE